MFDHNEKKIIHGDRGRYFSKDHSHYTVVGSSALIPIMQDFFCVMEDFSTIVEIG